MPQGIYLLTLSRKVINFKVNILFRMLRDFKPPYNATVYERLAQNGAVLIGKTNLDQFGMGSGTIDSSFGATKNVWKHGVDKEDNWNIAGGSSGGSAVAVATGACYAYVILLILKSIS